MVWTFREGGWYLRCDVKVSEVGGLQTCAGPQPAGWLAVAGSGWLAVACLAGSGGHGGGARVGAGEAADGREA
jgi:hypothetical protein